MFEEGQVILNVSRANKNNSDWTTNMKAEIGMFELHTRI